MVATPIGNLRDITLRALDTLRAADVILAEDTRQTRKLLDAYDIKTPLSPYHDHNAAKRVPGVIKDLEDGKIVALVSDAGTPLVSDPGFKLVRACIEADIDVFPLPGASAVLAGLVKSGLPSDRFMFAGFLPPKSGARKTALEELASVKATLIFFETGPRIAACLKDMNAVLGERDVVLTRELTKRYEEGRHGSFESLIASVKAEPPRGELVLLLGPPKTGKRWSEAEVISALEVQVSELGVKRASAESGAMWVAQARCLSASFDIEMKTTAERKSYEKAGRRAENLACLYLRLKGYRILERRFKVRQGEVDIIARKGKVIAMIEVKQRFSETAVQDSVSHENQSRLMDAAETYINQRRNLKGMDFELRYDFLYVIGRWKIRHITNAFQSY